MEPCRSHAEKKLPKTDSACPEKSATWRCRKLSNPNCARREDIAAFPTSSAVRAGSESDLRLSFGPSKDIYTLHRQLSRTVCSHYELQCTYLITSAPRGRTVARHSCAGQHRITFGCWRCAAPKAWSVIDELWGIWKHRRWR